MMGVGESPCWVAATSSAMSLPPRTRMISVWWRMGCQVPSGDSNSPDVPEMRVCSM